MGKERKESRKGKEREVGNGEALAFVWAVEKLQTPHPELFSYYLICLSTAVYILTWTAVASLEDTLPTGWLSYGFWSEGLHPRLHITVLWDLYRSQWPGEPWTSTWESLGCFFFKVLGLRQPRMRTTALLLMASLKAFVHSESWKVFSLGSRVLFTTERIGVWDSHQKRHYIWLSGVSFQNCLLKC